MTLHHFLHPPDACSDAALPVHQDITVRRRTVFFVPGYDPNAPRRYRELYRKEGAKQACISGYALIVARRPTSETYGWSVKAEMEGVTTQTDFVFLRWEDLVRGSMARGVLGTSIAALRTAWMYLWTGTFWRLLRLRPQPMVAALYPLVVISLQLCLAIGLAVMLFGLAPMMGIIPAVALGVLAGAALLTVFYRLDPQIYAYYLANDYAYTAGKRGAYPAGLSERISAFAAQISERAMGDDDEVLVVGHSSGAQLAVSSVAEALARAQTPPRAALSLLTLGQVIPMVSFLPDAKRLRRDLNDLSASPDIAWIDFSAPGDGGCFALSDPVHVTGVAPPEPQKRWPKVLSAAFSQSLSPALLRQTKWRFFRRHIQYLCAFDRPGDFDYFAITAGPRTLDDRYAWRGATASRVERPLSAYRDGLRPE